MTDRTVREIRVPVVPMTAEAFAPCGTVFGREAAGPERVAADAAFAHEGRATLGTIWNPPGGTRFSRLERHHAVTQAFVQLSGAPAVVCAAPPTDLEDPAALPDPASVRGFLIDPGQGWRFHRGTWHALDRCVLAPPGACFLIVNSAPNPTQIIDFATRESAIHPDLDGGPAPQPLPWPGAPPCRFVVDA